MNADESHNRSSSVLGSYHRPGGRPLYKEMEERYKRNAESETLEHRKEVLAQIRAMKKPMTKEEIEEHAKKYLEEKEKRI